MSTEKRLAQLFQALADPTRLRLVRLVAAGEACASDLHGALRMSQPRIARHLKILVESGVLLSRRDGRFVRYVLPTGNLAASVVRDILNEMQGLSAPPIPTFSPAPPRPEAPARPLGVTAPIAATESDTRPDDRPDDRLEDFLL
jgi:ArsR family transcriptional regulator